MRAAVLQGLARDDAHHGGTRCRGTRPHASDRALGAHGAVCEADLAEFVKQRGSMTGGWTGSFDKLEALVQRSKPH